jgi:N-acetylmuramate 1-kinase
VKSSPADERAEAARAWAVEQLKLAAPEFAPASADASFRRYFLIAEGERSWIIMDAPPERENCEPFVRIAGLMRAAGLHVPEVLARDEARGYLLLTDLGTQTYLDVLNERNADALFSEAIGALIRWQLASQPHELPAYDTALLTRELRLFPEWFLDRHLQHQLTGVELGRLHAIEDFLVRRALAQPAVYVHRDYMPRNLMLSTPNPGVLDFQDAVHGPITYDVLSLFKDAFRSWPEPRVRMWVRQYWEQAQRARLPVGRDFASFYADFELIGVQRHLKVIGIFARIHHRDGKPQYLQDVPRFIRYVREVAPRHRELSSLLRLFDDLGLVA